MPHTVMVDPDAVFDLEDVKAKNERKATYNAIDKLRRVGPALSPPHAKSLKGEADLFELRPRQGRSPVRPIYCRLEDMYVILAIGTKDTFEARLTDARARAKQYLS
jgi:hypothetical protein